MDSRPDASSSSSSRASARRSSAQRSPSAHDAGSSPSSKTTPPPTFLTSFPSFSPPEPPTPTSAKSKRRGGATPERKSGPSSNNMAAAAAAPGSSAVNRTVAAAAQLKKTILDSISYRSASSSAAASSAATASHLFDAPDWAAGDPLAVASDEHVLRIVGACGGVVPAVRKYSSDLAESNERVAAERNSKLRLVEENRGLRARLDEQRREVEEERERVEVVRRLFEKYVGKVAGGQPRVQVLESPNGPYVLGGFCGVIRERVLMVCRGCERVYFGDVERRLCVPGCVVLQLDAAERVTA
jgi:hypothetical protein